VVGTKPVSTILHARTAALLNAHTKINVDSGKNIMAVACFDFERDVVIVRTYDRCCEASTRKLLGYITKWRIVAQQSL
jgi:hypothetical protein